MLLSLHILLALVSQAPDFDEYAWRADNTVMEFSFASLVAVDVAQTAVMMGVRNKCGKPVFYEMNPILGTHPSNTRLWGTMAFTLIWHAAVSAALPTPYREAWQTASIGIEAVVVGANFRALSVGIRGSM